MLTQFERLRETVLKERKWGHTTCEIIERQTTNGGTAINAVDTFIEGLGFTGLDDEWEKIEMRQAQAILQAILYKDLAYSVPNMTVQRACQLTEQFLSLFIQPCHYLTNGKWELGRLVMWSGITEEIQDTGVVCINPQFIGMLWVQDDD